MSGVNYPKGIKPIVPSTAKKKHAKRQSALGFGNRGMDFEAAINDSNQYYLEQELMVVYKRPTPINIVTVDYSKGAIITKAYFEAQSTTDYNGVYQGHYIDFEAKSTRNKTSFPLSNINKQQIEHIKRVLASKGWAFFLIDFTLLNEVYLLHGEYVVRFYEERKRASIPLEDVRAHGKLIKEGFHPRYDYMPAMLEVFDR